jgi:hypothetical protein
LELLAVKQVSRRDSFREDLGLTLVIRVIDTHVVAGGNEPVFLKAGDSCHVLSYEPRR